jgi:hypothetical protein
LDRGVNGRLIASTWSSPPLEEEVVPLSNVPHAERARAADTPSAAAGKGLEILMRTARGWAAPDRGCPAAGSGVGEAREEEPRRCVLSQRTGMALKGSCGGPG